MNNILKDKVALITGASSGIGKEIAIRFASLGINLVISGRNIDKLNIVKDLTSKYGVKVAVIACDLTDENALLSLVDKAFAFFNKLDIVVNDAGMTLNCPFETTSLSDYDKIMNLNAKAPFVICQKAIKYLKHSSFATIINISSVVAHKGYVNQSAYSASKHALSGFTKSLANEVYKDNIRVHLIAPGGVYTDMVAISRPDLSPDGMILPKDIADTCEFILLKRNSNAVIDEINIHRAQKEPF